MSKVSVIIPVYNTEKYLVKCLESVCQQTLKDIEIICVNDCSPDNSLQILQEYAEKDNRIKIIDFKENRGSSIARNTGINQAQGEYIGFIDSDDFVDLDFYEKLYNNAHSEDADCAKANIYNFDIESNKSKLTDFYDHNSKIKKNKACFLYGFTSAIYKRSMIIENNIFFPESISHFEDPYFSIKASYFYNKISITTDTKYYYIQRKDSVCSSYHELKSIKIFISSVKYIFDLINNLESSKEDYLIRLNFLLERVKPFCDSTQISLESNKLAINLLSEMLENSKLPLSEVLTYYFMEIKSNFFKQAMKKIRTQKKELADVNNINILNL